MEGFETHWPNAWPDMDSALKEVHQALAADRINRLAVDNAGAPIGWIGAIRQYSGNTWEMHPLIVRDNRQGAGIGRALVNDLEQHVREHGGLTIYLGTDDEDNMTTLGGRDLYPNVVENLIGMRNLHRHPHGFYEKLGYVVVGVIPDANGPGKPDIIMAKRVGRLRQK